MSAPDRQSGSLNLTGIVCYIFRQTSATCSIGVVARNNYRIGHKTVSKIIFFNQGVGQLFRELVTAAAMEFGPVTLYASDREPSTELLRVAPMPHYDNSNGRTRVVSWIKYLAHSALAAMQEERSSLLFIVTNPPLSPLVGLMANRIQNRRYLLLFYDMYPEALVRFAGVSESSPIVQIWRTLNRLAIRHAACVVTISPRLADTLTQYYPASADATQSIHIVPTWVNTEYIHPVPKEENWFAAQHGQTDKLTVLYAGNLGAVHDLSMLPSIAQRITDIPDVHFMVIGSGAGRTPLEAECKALGLKNVTFLPFQLEEVLPYSLSTGDIGIVSLAAGAEGISMPSKTYYTMAAGSALLGFSTEHSDLAHVIRTHQCGINITPGDIDTAASAIRLLHSQPALLRALRSNARTAAETYYSDNVCIPQFLKLVKTQLAGWT
jgi:glycosyltransferase involved in cell wall biosynthesis